MSLTGCMRGENGRRLPAHAAGLVGIVAIIANQVRPLGGNMLRELGDKIERIEDLEIPLPPLVASVVSDK